MEQEYLLRKAKGGLSRKPESANDWSGRLAFARIVDGLNLRLQPNH